MWNAGIENVSHVVIDARYPENAAIKQQERWWQSETIIAALVKDNYLIVVEVGGQEWTILHLSTISR